MRIIITLILVMTSTLPLFLKAQQINTLYFMEDVPVRHILNPSFEPVTDYYLSLPVIGLTQFNVGNNSVSLKDVVYKVGGRTITFLDPQGDKNLFYNTLKPNSVVRADLQTNLISFGFRHESDYWTFTMTEKLKGTINLPKDLFRISLFGAQNILNNTFDATGLQGDISAYTESAVGYATQLDKKWRVGGKLKLLVGSANLSNHNNLVRLNIGIDQVLLQGDGFANYSGPVQLIPGNNSQSFTAVTPTTLGGWLKPSGLGAGFDIGCEYQLNKKIELSAALNDVGFIHWSANALNYHSTDNYNFAGINLFNNNSTVGSFQDIYNQLVSGNVLSDTIVKVLKKSLVSDQTNNSYFTATTAKLNLGFEYSLIQDKLNLGLLSYSQLFRFIVTEEVTASVNSHPYNWLDASLSYSLVNGRFSTYGAGLGIKTGFIHWFVAADYIPFYKASLSLSDLGFTNSSVNIPIPYNSTTFNVSAGMNIVFDKMKPKSNRGLIRSKKRNDCNCEWF